MYRPFKKYKSFYHMGIKRKNYFLALYKNNILCNISEPLFSKSVNESVHSQIGVSLVFNATEQQD